MGYAKNKKAIVLGTSSCATTSCGWDTVVMALFGVYKPPCMWLRTGRTEEFKAVRVETEFPAPGNKGKYAMPLSMSYIKSSSNQIAKSNETGHLEGHYSRPSNRFLSR